MPFLTKERRRGFRVSFFPFLRSNLFTYWKIILHYETEWKHMLLLPLNWHLSNLKKKKNHQVFIFTLTFIPNFKEHKRISSTSTNNNRKRKWRKSNTIRIRTWNTWSWNNKGQEYYKNYQEIRSIFVLYQNQKRKEKE